MQRNSSAACVIDSTVCDDHDCDAAPAIVQSDDTLKSDSSSNVAVSVVHQVAKIGSEADRIALQIQLLRSTSPPSHKTILRV